MLLLAGLALAASWHHCRWNLFGGDDLGLFARTQQQPVCIEAVALQTPRVVPQPEFNPLRSPRSGDEVRLDVELRAIRDGDQWRTASGRAALIVEGLVPDLAAGDRFQAFAHLLPPDHALNPGEDDRAARDRGRRITSHLRVNYPEAISVVSTGFACGPARLLESLRLRGRQVFANYLRPQQANLAAAVLLGLREQLDPEETEAFQLTGTVHLLVIAGLHLGILAGFAGLVLRRLLPWRWGLPAVAVFTICLYAAGRCPAAGGAGNRAHRGGLRGGLRRPPPRRFQCLGPGRPDRAGPQSGRSVQCRAAAFLLVRRRTDGDGAVVDGDDARRGPRSDDGRSRPDESRHHGGA